MNNALKKIKTLSPFLLVVLISTFPILFFYSTNISILSLKFLETTLTYSLSGGVIILLFLLIVIKDKNKAAIISSLFIFIFFSYGHLSRPFDKYIFIKLPNNIVLGPDKILFPVLFVLITFMVYKTLKSKKQLNQVISTLNLCLLLLIGYQIFTIANWEHKKIKSEKTTESITQNQEAKNKNTPDIYHIILDGYARNDILEKYYNYDNSEFTNTLTKMGFYVVKKARANYIHTYLSLPSTFNMTYLDFLPDKYGKNPAHGSAGVNLMLNNQVSKKLKNYGYTTINFTSEWEGTNENYKADIKYKSDQYSKILGINLFLSETNMVFLQTTILSPFIKEVWGDALRSRILTVFQKLPDITYQKEKKYTLAHILAPHPPYVFTKDGKPVEGSEFQNADEGITKRPLYRDQLIFVSSQIIPVLQKIIANSEKPPIIILQSDHGPASTLGRREDWKKNYSLEGIDERTGMLLALYFPDQDYQKLYQTMTPVNIYRIIFNKYFGENYDLLPDKTFYTSYDAIYNFKDITQELKREK